MTDVGVLPGGSFSIGLSVNMSDQGVGDADVSGRVVHAFVWNGGVLTDLGTLPGYDIAHTRRISDVGQIVGWMERTTSDNIRYGRAFVYREGRLLDLGGLPGLPDSKALGINAAGQIVGTSGSVFGNDDEHDRALDHRRGNGSEHPDCGRHRLPAPFSGGRRPNCWYGHNSWRRARLSAEPFDVMTPNNVPLAQRFQPGRVVVSAPGM